MFQWMKRSQRGQDPAAPIPMLAAVIAHLEGPGAVRLENNRLTFASTRAEPDVQARQVRLELDRLEILVCYGAVQFSTEAMAALLEKRIDVALLNASGTSLRGWITAPDSVRPLERIRQCSVVLDPQKRLLLARQIVADKIRSQIGGARHYQRHGFGRATDILARLAPFVERAEAAAEIRQLLGIEGAASAVWFELFAALVRKPFQFPKRARRPPTDPVNALLSLGYTLLLSRIEARLAALGFDAAIGILHELRPGRPSLACDHLEPLRVPAVDRWVLRVLNEGRLALIDFEAADNGGLRLTKQRFPKTVAGWESFWLELRGSDMLDEQLRRFRKMVSDLAGAATNLDARLDQGGP